ncbi:MAG: hypothetical protein M3Y33_06215 [Actinomycetota bacterium]|nr:hypothetical protein [Actinomycetota bacterium]
MNAPPVAPVNPQQAAEHCAVLLHELAIFEAGRRVSARAGRAAIQLAAGTVITIEPPVAAPALQLQAAGPEPLDLSAGEGISPARRAVLMAAAKARAIEFAIAVRSRNAHLLQRLTAGMSLAEWQALAIACADAADPARLLVVVQAADDGVPAHLSTEGRTNAA